jgi:hypothetical protein
MLLSILKLIIVMGNSVKFSAVVGQFLFSCFFHTKNVLLRGLLGYINSQR